MSKRFGRNQRRRAREALAAQVEQTTAAREEAQDRLSMYHYERQKSAEMRRFFKDVARRVGEQAFIAGGKSAIGIQKPGQTLRAVVFEELDFSRVTAPAATSRMMTETLHHLETRAVRDPFRQELLFEAYLNGKSAGVCLSESLINRVSKEELVHVIQNSVAPQLAHHLAEALKGK
jgi:hypothetical protein